MKIGIMTWFRYSNFGTVLQAYSLEKTIEKLGYEAELLDYKPRGKNQEINDFNDFCGKVKQKLFSPEIQKDKSKFEEFVNNNIKYSAKLNNYFELKNISNEYDGFVCGSDQIWSPDNFDANYFLNFANKEKIMSYAPSLGKSQINDPYIINKMKRLIERFNVLSVREEAGKNIISKNFDKTAKVVLDPTLLLSKEDWYKLLNKDMINERYILCYFLGNSNKNYRNIYNYAKKNNLKIINIPTIDNQKLNVYNYSESVGPLEFLNLIKNASCICTDSFHGVIFSINFNKKFYAYKRFSDKDKRSQNSRITNILEKLDLSHTLIDSETQLNNLTINYDTVNIKLKNLVDDSIAYLDEGLSIITNSKIEKDDYFKHITNYCCGCGACSVICPTKAIKISLNQEGFYEYSIDSNKCINCGLCKKTCPMNNINSKAIDNTIKCYSVKSKEQEVIKESASGGAGFHIARYLNKNGYYVCGATYDNNINRAKHIIIAPNNEEKLKLIQGSKYVQSNTVDCFNELIKLPKDAKVAFFGTPCQVSALSKLISNYNLKNNYLLIEIICHGVPSYVMWDKYLEEINKKNNNKEQTIIKFRNKEFGWKDRRITIANKNFKYVGKDNNDSFYLLFRNSITDNKSCYECPYRLKSCADLRIGDYWSPKFFSDRTGVSMLLCLSDKGDGILNNLNKKNIIINKENIDDYFKYQLIDNQNPVKYRETIISDIKNGTELKKIRKSYLKYNELKDKVYEVYNMVKKENEK